MDLVADGAFDGHLTAEQQGVKKRIESLIARTRGTPSAGRISCSTLTTFENILLPADGPGGQGRKLEEMKRKEEEEKEEERKTEESTEKGKETKPVKEEQEIEEAERKPEDSKEQGKEEKKLEKEEEERKPRDSNEKGKEEKKLEKEEEEKKPEESAGKGNEEKKQVKEEEKEEEDKERNLERKEEERKKNEEDEAGDSGNDTEEGLADDTKHSDIGTKDKYKTKEKDSSVDESEAKEDTSENRSTQDASIHTTADANLGQMKTLHNSRQTKAKQNTRLLTPMCQDRERKCHWSEQLILLLSRPENPRAKIQSRLGLFGHCQSPASSWLGKWKTKEQSSVHCYYYYLIAQSGKNVRYETLPEREPMVRMIQRSCHVARKCSSRCFYGSRRQQCLQNYDIHSNQSQKRSAADTGRADDQETKPAGHGNLQTDDTEPLRSETETDDTEADEDKNDEEERNSGQETEEPAEDSRSETDDNKDEEAAEDDGVAKADGDDTHVADDTDIDDAFSETEQDEHSKLDEDESQEPKHDMTAKANKRKTSRHSETDEGDIVKKNDGSDDARDSNSKSSTLSKEDLLKLEALFQQKASEQAAKVQSLEILVMKLENQILAQKLTEQNGSSHIVHLENQILRIENELLKLNQSYLTLHEENEVLKSRQNKYLALEHKSSDTSENRPALPSNSSKYFELVTMQQEKLATLSDLLGNQSSALHKLRLRSDKLEEQNQALYQIVMNQTALISHVMQKLQEVSEQNLKNRQETGQLRSALDMQSASYNLIHKLENMLDEASPRVGSPSQKATTFASSVLLDGSSSGSSQHQNVKFSHVLKFLPVMSGAFAERWKCEGNESPSLCLLFTILLSPCPPFRTLSWSKCPYRLGQVESGGRRPPPQKDTEAVPLESGDMLNEQGAFSGASSKHLNVDTWVLDTTRATQPQTKTEQAPAKREDTRPTPSLARDKEATNSEFSARTERSSAKDSSEHQTPPSGSKRLSEQQSESLPATSTQKDGVINSKEESNPLQTKDGKEAPDSVNIPALQASSPEPNTGPGTKNRGGKVDDSAEKSSASVPAKPPTSTVLPQALGATDGQKAESEDKKPEIKDTEAGSKDKKAESKGDSPERLKSTGVLPEAVNAIDDKAQTKKDTPETSTHLAAKKATQGQQKTDEQQLPGFTEKTKPESTDSKERGGEEQREKKEEEKMKAEEEKKRKEAAEKAKKLEQQKREAEIMAKKIKAAETRVLAYWSADNRKPKGTWKSAADNFFFVLSCLFHTVLLLSYSCCFMLSYFWWRWWCPYILKLNETGGVYVPCIYSHTRLVTVVDSGLCFCDVVRVPVNSLVSWWCP